MSWGKSISVCKEARNLILLADFLHLCKEKYIIRTEHEHFHCFHRLFDVTPKHLLINYTRRSTLTDKIGDS